MSAGLVRSARAIMRRADKVTPEGHVLFVVLTDGDRFTTVTNHGELPRSVIATMLRLAADRVEHPEGVEVAPEAAKGEGPPPGTVPQ
jgi:Mg-chelatase subunit ChlD